MGYDVHVTLADDWTEASASPIAEGVWAAVVAADPDLSVSHDDWLDQSQPDGTVRRVHPVVWKGTPLWFIDGEITAKNPNDSVEEKLVQIASRLGARVFGDDGEEYT